MKTYAKKKKKQKARKKKKGRLTLPLRQKRGGIRFKWRRGGTPSRGERR